jgi:NADPH2 dehydrogenase
MASNHSSSRLFKPLKLNSQITLQHRVGMCPLTRSRATDDHIPTDMMRTYYSQRASVPGTLIITEGTFPLLEQGGWGNVPGIYNDKQVEAWKPITKAVHDKGSFIFCQLWALGRAAKEDQAKKDGFTVTSSSDKPMEGGVTPKALTEDEIKKTIQGFADAARNAIRAGFDGVEIHGANGYLIDQFIQDVSNFRTDKYGGSIENRSRFAAEVVLAVAEAIGEEKVGIRFSPWSEFQSMRMKDPIPQFSDLIRRLTDFKLAYIHLIECRVSGNVDVEGSDKLDFAYDIWKGNLLVAGGHDPNSAYRMVDEEHPDRDIVVMFGRFFLSTPDLPFRIQHGIDPNEYDRDTFYAPKQAHGYIDYPFSQEFKVQQPDLADHSAVR